MNIWRRAPSFHPHGVGAFQQAGSQLSLNPGRLSSHTSPSKLTWLKSLKLFRTSSGSPRRTSSKARLEDEYLASSSFISSAWRRRISASWLSALEVTNNRTPAHLRKNSDNAVKRYSNPTTPNRRYNVKRAWRMNIWRRAPSFHPHGVGAFQQAGSQLSRISLTNNRTPAHLRKNSDNAVKRYSNPTTPNRRYNVFVFQLGGCIHAPLVALCIHCSVGPRGVIWRFEDIVAWTLHSRCGYLAG
jgi:hypothetical protein